MIIIILSFVGTGRRGMNQPWKVQLCSPSPSLVQSSWAWSWTRLVPIVGGGKRTSVATQWCTTPPAASFPIISFSTLRIENFTHVLARTEGGYFFVSSSFIAYQTRAQWRGIGHKIPLEPLHAMKWSGNWGKKNPSSDFASMRAKPLSFIVKNEMLGKLTGSAVWHRVESIES